jgi:SET domain-containing protein
MMLNLNESWVLDATRAGSSARFARRIKDGNCRLAAAKDPAGAMHIYLQAISDVSEGEEITIRSV